MSLVVGLALIATTVLATTISAPTIGESEGQVTVSSTMSNQIPPTTEGFKAFLAQQVTKYGGNYYQLYKVIECESGWNPNAKNPHSSAFGIAQFMPDTFKGYCGGEYKDPFSQIHCLVVAMTDKHEGWWECWKMLNN